MYLAGVLAPFHIASTHHVLLDKVGLLGLGVDIVQAVTGLTTDRSFKNEFEKDLFYT